MALSRDDLIRANPSLSRFDPLRRMFFFDDFDNGINGWTELIGNYENTLDAVQPPMRDFRPPQLSNLSMWDTGTVGSIDGTYALKLATRPRKSHQAFCLKRITFREPCPLRLELYFTFKPEASELRLLDQDVRSVGIVYDLQNDTERVMPHIRYLNSFEGSLEQKWQYKEKRTAFRPVGDSGATVSHYHMSPEGWKDIPHGHQKLCYNEIATKHNWHYFRLDFDLRNMQFLSMECNDHDFDVASLGSQRMDAMPNLWNMLNVCFIAETDADKRAFFYLDSVLLSGDF